jgi:capsular exopolysaccharide synthesis family protein
MSEFFKALEQAERDRLRQGQADTVPASPSAPVAPQDGERRAEPPKPQPVIEPVDAKASVAPSPPRRPAAKRAAAKAAEAGPASLPFSVASPASVFRAVLQPRERSRIIGRRSARPSALIAHTDPSSLEADAYRTVRANIELMSDNGAYRHIAITSAAGGDGKSTTAANLAIVAAQAGRRVCLVDADLRRPTLHDVFGLPNVDGLASALEYGRSLDEVARSADIENLSVVVAGRGVQDGFQDVLTSERLESVLSGSEAIFDLVIFDSPPIVVSDALGVAAACDGVILVVRAGSIPFGVLRRAIGQVKQVKGRVLGVLLNQADPRAGDADSYHYYHGYQSPPSPS